MQDVAHWGCFSSEGGVTLLDKASPRPLGLCVCLSLSIAAAVAGLAPECSEAGEATLGGLGPCEAHAAHC